MTTPTPKIPLALMKAYVEKSFFDALEGALHHSKTLRIILNQFINKTSLDVPPDMRKACELAAAFADHMDDVLRKRTAEMEAEKLAKADAQSVDVSATLQAELSKLAKA